MRKRKYSNEDIINAVKTSTSIAQVLEKLNIKGGGSHKYIKNIIKELNLDTSKFTGSKWSYGKNLLSNDDIELILSNQRAMSSNHLKVILFKYKILDKQCLVCGIKDLWQGKSITLELDHIDGNKYNNNLSNLRILCPNCHSQTPTYRRAKNNSYTCDWKSSKSTKIIWPSIDELLEKLKHNTLISLAKELNLASPSSIVRHIKKYGGENIDIPRFKYQK